MNDGLVDLLVELGCDPVLPDPSLIAVEDVRYLEQLARFRDDGVRDVVYLLSFGCLKGHVADAERFTRSSASSPRCTSRSSITTPRHLHSTARTASASPRRRRARAEGA